MVDERTRNRRGWLLFGLAILSLVLLFCTCADSRMIQDSLLSQGQTELDNAGLDPELIRVAGRDVSLEGVVGSPEAKLAAGAAVAALPGMRLFNNNLQITDSAVDASDADTSEAAVDEAVDEPEAAPSDEARLTLELDSAQAPSLSGNVDEATAELATDTLTPLSTEEVESDVAIQSAAATPDWFGGVIALAPDYAGQVEEGSLELTPERLTLNGVVPSEQARIDLGEAFSAAAGNTVDLDNQLRIVAAQPPSGLTFTVNEAPNGLSLSGEVSESAAMQLSDALTPLGVANTLNLNDDVIEPAWLGDVVNLTPDFVESVDEANVSVTEDSVTLAGIVLDEDERAAQVAAFEQAAPDTPVTDNLRLLADDEAAPEVVPEPANFRLEQSAAGTRLSGTLPENAAASLVDTLAPTTAEVRDDLALAAVTTPEWLPQLTEGLPSYTDEVQDAVLELEGQTLTLSGVVESEAQKQALGERISELSNGEAEVINNLEIVEPAEEPAEVEALEPEPAEEPVAEEPVAEEPVVEEAVVEEPVVEEPVAEPEPSDPVEASELPEPETAPSEPNLRIDVSGSSISLSGVVPDDALKTSAAQGYTKMVDNALELGNADEAILAPVIALGPNFAAEVERGSLNLQGDTLTLQGVVADEATRSALFEAASSAVGPNITVVNRLSLASSIPENEDGK